MPRSCTAVPRGKQWTLAPVLRTSDWCPISRPVADPFTRVRFVFDQQVLVGGGTSQAAPIWAGLAAVINGKLAAAGGGPLGDLNPVLYRVAQGSRFSSFHHIPLGDNAVSTSSDSGFDMVTGLGTPDVNNLVKAILLARSVAR